MSEIIKQTQLEQDEKTRSAILLHFKSGDDISISLIQRKCQVGYNSAYRTYNMLITDGLIIKPKNLSAVGTLS
jgi:DNA segregation ATPase FtsK/SpoIIIE-like protein